MSTIINPDEADEAAAEEADEAAAALAASVTEVRGVELTADQLLTLRRLFDVR